VGEEDEVGKRVRWEAGGVVRAGGVWRTKARPGGHGGRGRGLAGCGNPSQHPSSPCAQLNYTHTYS